MKKAIKSKKMVGVIGIFCSIAIIYYIISKIQLKTTIDELSKVNLIYFIFLAGLYLITFYLRAFRWKLMLGNFKVPFIICLEGLVVGFAGNNLVPARGGELLRMEFFSKKSGINRITSISSVFAEKILDGVSLILLMLVGFYLVKENLLEVFWLKNLFISINIIFSITILFLFLFKFFNNRISLFLQSRENKFFELGKSLFIKISDGLSFLKFNFNTVQIIILGIFIWSIEGSMFMVGCKILNINVNIFPVGLILLTIVNFGLLVPSSPGYVGVFQGMTILGLSVFGIPNEKSLSLSILVHAAQFIPITLWGVIILLRSTVFVNLLSHKK